MSSKCRADKGRMIKRPTESPVSPSDSKQSGECNGESSRQTVKRMEPPHSERKKNGSQIIHDEWRSELGVLKMR